MHSNPLGLQPIAVWFFRQNHSIRPGPVTWSAPNMFFIYSYK